MVSLIVSIYKRLDMLDLVLQSIGRQSYKDFEVIVAEDDNTKETIDFLENARKKYSYRIKHVSQEDDGFRKTKILNAAVVAAEGEQLVFIDGDCILHKHFLKEYAKAITQGKICYGRRAYLSKKITKKLLQTRNSKHLTFFSAWLAGSNYMGTAIYLPNWKSKDKQYREILGCNWGVLRGHLIEVNGFEEDYVRAGAGEDLDMDWRLKSLGLHMKSMKNKAIVYHLFHNPNYNADDLAWVNNLLAQKKKAGRIICVNGITK